MRDGDLVWCEGHGWIELASGPPPDEHTLFRIASITKTFTATAIVQLREEGGLRLDDALVAHLPELRRAHAPFGPIEEVTLRRVLMHEGGLMSESPGMDAAANVFPTTAEVLARPGRIRIAIPPGSAYKYSNLGYQLLGEVVARVAGVPYTDFVRERILEPLALASTTFDPGAAANVARGYEARAFSDFAAPAAVLSPSGLEADGGLWSTTADLARWIAFWCGPGGDAVLAPAAREEMLTPRSIANEDWSQGQGLAWYTERRGDVALAGHDGELDGYATAVRFSREGRTGAIALLNAVAPAGDLAFDLAARALAERSDPPRARRRPRLVPRETEALLGLYVLPKYGSSIRVEWRGDRLALLVDGREHGLEPGDGPLHFWVRGGREAGEELVFERGERGRITGLNLAGYPYVRLREADPG